MPFPAAPLSHRHRRLCLRRVDRIADRLPFHRHRRGSRLPAEGRSMDSLPAFRFLTAALHVDYLRPTPIDVVLEIRASVKEIKGRKVIVASTLSAGGEICARGEVVTVRLPDHLVVE